MRMRGEKKRRLNLSKQKIKSEKRRGGEGNLYKKRI